MKTKVLISCSVTAQLICVFVFEYAKSSFSHEKDRISRNMVHMQCSSSYSSIIQTTVMVLNFQTDRISKQIEEQSDQDLHCLLFH